MSCIKNLNYDCSLDDPDAFLFGHCAVLIRAPLHFAQGKVKAKVISSVMESLSSPEQYMSEEVKEKKVVPLAELKEGVNPGCAVMVGVAAIVPLKERVP